MMASTSAPNWLRWLSRCSLQGPTRSISPRRTGSDRFRWRIAAARDFMSARQYRLARALATAKSRCGVGHFSPAMLEWPAMAAFNYFNYFTEVEEYFWRKRGARLLVSPLDWAIVETWQKAGIPLEAVLKGIDRAFESYQRSRRAAGEIGR